MFVGVDVYLCDICESEPAHVATGCCHLEHRCVVVPPTLIPKIGNSEIPTRSLTPSRIAHSVGVCQTCSTAETPAPTTAAPTTPAPTTPAPTTPAPVEGDEIEVYCRQDSAFQASVEHWRLFCWPRSLWHLRHRTVRWGSVLLPSIGRNVFRRSPKRSFQQLQLSHRIFYCCLGLA